MSGASQRLTLWGVWLMGVTMMLWSLSGCSTPEQKNIDEKNQSCTTCQEKTDDAGAKDDVQKDASIGDEPVKDDAVKDEPPIKKSSAPVPEGFVNTSVFVDTAWLEKNLGKVRVLDIRSEENYNKGHIPGAVYFPRTNFLRTFNDVPNIVTDAKTFSKHLRKAGISKDTHVIVVDDNNMLWGSRLHWTLDYFGIKASSLHGGIAAWIKDEREVTREVPTPDATNITVEPDKALISIYGDLLKRIQAGDKSLIVLDSRTKGEYDGTDARSKYGGHIPGAIHVDWAEHLVKGSNPPVLKSVEELKKLYLDKGVTKDKEIASYCQTAIRATHAYLVLKALGYEKLKIYDGSWTEWGNKDDSPKEKK